MKKPEAPRFAIGDVVENEDGLRIIISAIELDRPVSQYNQSPVFIGYSYQSKDRKAWYQEDNLSLYLPPAKVITKDDFHYKWNQLYGCTWDNAASAKTYQGLIEWLKEKGVMHE